MSYANIASLTKMARANQIISAIGSNGIMKFYTGILPSSPDIAPSGTLLASLPLSTVAGVASLAIQKGVVTSPGTGGTNGIYMLTITGTGIGAGGTFTVLGGVLNSISITANGRGYTAPTFSGFASAGLTGAAAISVLTGVLIFNTISSATSVATGTATFVRVTTSGGTGIMDLDVGTTNSYSVIMSNTFVAMSSTVSISANVLTES
jgi:hypothetical protein